VAATVTIAAVKSAADGNRQQPQQHMKRHVPYVTTKRGSAQWWIVCEGMHLTMCTLTSMFPVLLLVLEGQERKENGSTGHDAKDNLQSSVGVGYTNSWQLRQQF
jgi:hypothetical protein